MSSHSLDAFLPASFRRIVYEVHQLEGWIRTQLRRGTWDETSRPTAPEELRQKLAARLEELAKPAQASGLDPESADFVRLRWLLASVADGALTAFEWWGKTYWATHPLAGDFPPPDGVPADLSRQIEDLLEARDPDPDWVQVFLLALASRPSLEASSVEYGRRLFRLLSESFPQVASSPERLFPHAYRRRQRRGAAARLPASRGWLVALVAAGLLLVAISAPLWLRATAVAREAVQQVLSLPE